MKLIISLFMLAGMATANEVESSAIVQNVDYLECGKKYVCHYQVVGPVVRYRRVEGLALVKVDGKFGYIDESRESVVEPVFDYAESFREGLALVMIDDKFGYINKSGESVVEPIFDYAQSFQEGLALVKIDGKFGYIDKSGEFVIGPLDWAWNFHEGLAKVKVGEKYGYIDKAGEFVIGPIFDFVWNFQLKGDNKSYIKLHKKLKLRGQL